MFLLFSRLRVSDSAVTEDLSDRQHKWSKELTVAREAFEELGGEFIQADGCAPFQAMGRWRRFTFYFRSRHDHWTLTVGPATAVEMDVVASGLVIAQGDDTEIWDDTNWSNPAIGFRFAVQTLDNWINEESDALN